MIAVRTTRPNINYTYAQRLESRRCIFHTQLYLFGIVCAMLQAHTYYLGYALVIDTPVMRRLPDTRVREPYPRRETCAHSAN